MNTEEYEFLLSSISHELRNPVALINSYLQLTADRHPEVTSYEQWQPLLAEMNHLRRLLDEISSFHNGSRITETAVDMDQWLPAYAASAGIMINELANTQTGNHCTLPVTPKFLFHSASRLPVISIDPHKLQQVLDNLIRNAVEAVCLPGSIHKCKTADSSDTITLTAFKKDDVLSIMVSDTGCGISSEYKETLFEPFVSQKPDGTGLGLAISKRIIEAHGGSISISSAPGCGTTFTVLLPAYGTAAAPAKNRL